MSLWDNFYGAVNALRKNWSFSISLATAWTGYRKETPMPKYFKPEEVEGLNEQFVAKLDAATARTIDISLEKQRIPFVITSGLRTPEANQSLGGAVSDSAHLTGHAVDLAVATSHDVWIIVAALRDAGINRIGVYVNKEWQPTHIHCDDDPDKVPQVLFIKGEQN